MAVTSYIKLIQFVDDFASQHEQIQRFKAEFDEQMPNFATETEAYPILFMSPVSSVFAMNEDTYTVTFYCFDIIQKDRANINTIVSDTNLILNDLKKYFKDGDNYTFDIIGDPIAVPLNNALLDYAGGWQMTVTFSVDTYSYCEIPFADSPLNPVEGYDVVYSRWLTCDTVTGCTSFQQYIANALSSFSGNTSGYFTSGSSGNYSIKVINDTTTDATDDYATAFGVNTHAGGVASFAEGINTEAKGRFSHAEGLYTMAAGEASHAEGNGSTAMGDYSHAEGINNVANGEASHAEGYGNIVTGKHSHAEGFQNVIDGDASHAEGALNTITGDYSHVGGYNNQIVGSYSLIHGNTNNLIIGDNSYVLSQSSELNANNSAIIGGAGIIGNKDNTVYVPYLNVGLLETNSSINNLGIDVDGNIVVGNDIYITGFTYANNTLTITNNDNSSLSSTINVMTGLTINGNLDVTTIDQTNSIDFNTGATVTGAVGRLKWNDTEGTLDLGLKGGNVTLQVGQENVARVVNKTVPNIDLLESNYQVVYVSGAAGQRLGVKLAQANSDITSAGTLGVVTETILKNQEGFITTFGRVNEINTTGSLQGETWNDGDVLYLSPTTAGKLTNVKPVAPQHLISVGYVEYAHAIHGKIFVKVDNGYELEELHNVQITGTPKGGSVLEYNQSLGVWKAVPITWTIDLMTSLSIDMYAPYDLKIDTITNILNTPTITIYDDGSLYSLGDIIAIGSKITITGSTNGVTNLEIEKL